MIAPTILFLALLLAPRPAAPAAVPPTATSNPRPTIPVDRAFLPVLLLPGRVTPPAPPTATAIPTRSATADLRTRLQPATDGALKAALLVPGALVLPAAGEYWPHAPLRVAAGVTLDGRGAVTLRGEGLLLYKADGATIRGVTILDADGDAIGVNRSAGILIDHVDIGGWGDGGIDIVRTPAGSPAQIIRDTVLHDGKKGSLLGHQWESTDDGARILLERVTFRSVQVRTPKVHRASVTMVDCTVINWSGPVLDVQLGGHINMVRTRLIAGQGSQRGYYTPTGGSVSEVGTVFVPYKPRTGAE